MASKTWNKIKDLLRYKLLAWLQPELLNEEEALEQTMWKAKKVIDEYRDFVENLATLAREGSEYAHNVKAKKRSADERVSPFWDSLEYDVFLTLVSDECYRDQKNIHEFTVSTVSINEAKTVCTANAEAYGDYGKLRLYGIETESASRKKGFGSSMLEFLKAYCSAHGLREIHGTIGTSPYMEETGLRTFYEKNGFVFNGRRFSFQIQ